MKILLIAIGTRGDVQPFIAAGIALRSRGHQVSVAASAAFSDMIRTAELDHYTLPVDFRELMKQPDIQAAMTSVTGKFKAYRSSGEIMNEQLNAIWSIGHDIVPDLVLHHVKAVNACYLARSLGIRSVPVTLQPGFASTGDYPQFLVTTRPLGKTCNLLTHRLVQNLIRFGTSSMISRWVKASGNRIGPTMSVLNGYSPGGSPLRLHAWSKAICSGSDDWSSDDVQTGYFFSDSIDYQPSPELAHFLNSGPTPIYMGFGSMPEIDANRTAVAVHGALERSGLRAVVSKGWGNFENLKESERIHVLDDVPHTWLFPQVTAVVHHGGSGTTHEGLRWGKPTLVCPLFGDQPFFGARVHALGAGPAPIAQKRLNTENLAEALIAVQSQDMRDRAQAIGRQLRAENWPAVVSDALEI